MTISCEKAADICNRKQYKEASWWQVIQLKFHILICKTCNQFSTKNTKFTSLCEKANLHVISEKEKETMKKELEKQF